jgi:disulfide bond formation protein DsbB
MILHRSGGVVTIKRTAFWKEYGPYLAFGTALVATLGSLYYSEIVGFVPCTLCWYQRILMYPITILALVGILTRDDDLWRYVLPLSLAGMGLSTYHYLIQRGLIAHSAVCSVGVPCGLRYVNYLGFVTIPLMALTAFVIITGSMALTRWATHRAAAQPVPGGDRPPLGEGPVIGGQAIPSGPSLSDEVN